MMMILARCSPVIVSSSSSSLLPAKFSRNSNSCSDFSIFPSKFSSKESSSSSSSLKKCSCTKNEENANIFENFSVISSEVPWDDGSIWSTMGFYIFSLHIPLSFGGLSVIARVMHQPTLDPQTQAVSMLLIQTLEILGTLVLLRYTAKPQYKIGSFLQSNNFSKQRNWVVASTLGFGFLITVVVVTSFLADELVGPKVMNNPVLQEILSSGPISKTACFLAYCFTTPLLEEIVYRGFLLGSLASTMKWQQAVILSSCIFSLAHFSMISIPHWDVVGSHHNSSTFLALSLSASELNSEDGDETVKRKITLLTFIVLHPHSLKKLSSSSVAPSFPPGRKMLAVFEKAIGKPPEAFNIPTIRSQSPKTSKTREEIADVYRSQRPDSTIYSLSNGNFMALSHKHEDLLRPRSIVVMDDIFCLFVGNIENICELRRHYGLSRNTTDAMLVIELYKVLYHRAPYPPDQVIRDLSGKFAFILFDAKNNNLFASRDRDGAVQLQWGMAGDGSVVFSDCPEIVSEACGKSCAAFPPGCIFMNWTGLVSFVHPLYKVRAILREDDGDATVCSVMFQVDMYTRIPSIPRTGSSSNWADATAAVIEGSTE